MKPADKPARENVFSGPQKGEKLTPFKVRAVYGKAAGKEVDFVSEAAKKPLFLIFVNGVKR